MESYVHLPERTAARAGSRSSNKPRVLAETGRQAGQKELRTLNAQLTRRYNIMATSEQRFRAQGRAFLLTWPQCTLSKQEVMNFMKAKHGNDLQYIVVCEEMHADGGRHIHCFILLGRRINTTNCRNWDIGAYHGNYKGVQMINVQQKIDYVKKDGDWIEEGERPLDRRRCSMKEKNKRIRELGVNGAIDEGLVSLQTAARLQASIEVLRMNEKRERRAPTVKWYYGSTGTGKTRLAVDEGGEDYWMSSADLRWFDGYHGQKTAILDDIRTGSCPFNFLLRVLDRYKLDVPIKGGFSAWTPEVIIITCPVHPNQLYVNRETGEIWDNVDQLIRRVTEFRDFDMYPYEGQQMEEDHQSEDYEELLRAMPELPDLGPDAVSHMEDVD